MLGIVGLFPEKKSHNSKKNVIFFEFRALLESRANSKLRFEEKIDNFFTKKPPSPAGRGFFLVKNFQFF